VTKTTQAMANLQMGVQVEVHLMEAIREPIRNMSRDPEALRTLDGETCPKLTLATPVTVSGSGITY